jgi:predicted RNase H-like nuclease (RuvC/YqgF family)
MNDKDKEAFDNYMEENKGVYFGMGEWEKDSDFNVWQAACEYKQEEIEHRDDLIYELEQNYLTEKENKEKLQAENKKLREALEYIYHSECAGCNLEEVMATCEEALKEYRNLT